MIKLKIKLFEFFETSISLLNLFNSIHIEFEFKNIYN